MAYGVYGAAKFGMTYYSARFAVKGMQNKAPSGSELKFGKHKSSAKWENQMQKRGWTQKQITEDVKKGDSFQAKNMVNKGNPATRYVHPETGRSIVVDNTTNEILHIGGDGYEY